MRAIVSWRAARGTRTRHLVFTCVMSVGVCVWVWEREEGEKGGNNRKGSKKGFRAGLLCVCGESVEGYSRRRLDNVTMGMC